MTLADIRNKSQKEFDKTIIEAFMGACEDVGKENVMKAIYGGNLFGYKEEKTNE